MTNEEVVHELQYLIGLPYEGSIKTAITQATGRTRVVGPNEMSTREFDPERVHVRVDASGAVSGFAFN
ncbi:I78 family peptidase inhibitor [Pseudomonas guariconensis]|uniref:I78 family peptidase inhibitor n=1 Tax=Pseudomonas guariconensis TaxID=1288410 RepID=UPI0018AA5667|nr:I78 family peptidase inhibitor [Pseudomonas guariconensis]MBF8742277.1 hypothetical protein [Pseudomonas guariconensis]MBF8751605.1 hypothetical protein [Pseudomonas guariconensis]